MTESAAAYVLKSSDGSSPPLLERVDVDAQVDGVLFTVNLRQTWRHAGTRPLEVIYTFPLPAQAVLLSFASTRGGDRLEGVILPRAQAEDRYEGALARGDAPALLEVGPDGLHTVNIGNLLPGESVVLELQFTQLLRFEHGRLRLVVPTTIAPRYGKPESSGLQAHQTPVSSLTAEYPLSMALTIAGSLAASRIECTTHRHQLARSHGTARLELMPGARMDRDVVVVLTPPETRPGLLVTGRDPLALRPRQVALAAFELPRRPSNRPLSLKLLVDCSGSMAGDSIDSAKAALRAVADLLGADDEVSLLRFGTTVQTALSPAPCTSAILKDLRQHIDATSACLGGTEMETALRATLTLDHRHEQSDLLLITDGQVWQSEAVADAARRSGQRVFAIGVGTAPAEGALRAIASGSGGACEFATPGDSLKATAVRMLERMRDAPWPAPRVDWGCEPVWQESPQGHAFGGDTLIALAAFEGAAAPEQARLVLDGSTSLATAASEACEPEVLARLLADRERRTLNRSDAKAVSVRYRLLTEHTHCVLVHEREDKDRSTTPADLVQVPSMLAAGWAGTGSVVDLDMMFSEEPTRIFACRSVPLLSQTEPLDMASGDLRLSEKRPVQQRPASPSMRTGPSRHLAGELEPLLPHGHARSLMGAWARGRRTSEAVRSLLWSLSDLGLSAEDMLVVIAHWSLTVEARSGTLPGWAQARLDALDGDLRERALQAIQEALGTLKLPAPPGRMQRLWQAMHR